MKQIIKNVASEAEKLVRAIPATAVKQIMGEKEENGNEAAGQKSGAGKRQLQADDAYLQLAKADDRQKTRAEISYLQRELDELRHRRQAEKQASAGDVVDEHKGKEEKEKVVKMKAGWEKQKEETLWGMQKKKFRTERFRGVSG